MSQSSVSKVESHIQMGVMKGSIETKEGERKIP